MRRLLVLLFVAFAALACSPQDARADRRVALVIGNSNYKNVPVLPNPANDAAAMAAMFRDAKFDVVEFRQDLNNLDTRRLLRDFSDKAQDADMAVVFYAGHGIEIDGVNYLIPTDALLQRDRDAYDEAVALDRILQTIEPAKKLRLVILDACRDNPFARTMKKGVASRSLGRGLIGIEPAMSNTLVAYAARGGSTAEDGSGSHSPFTTALLNYLTKPGLDVRKAFGFVRDDVMKSTNQQQEPFVYGSLGGTDVALVPAPVTATTVPAGAPEPRAEARRDYEFALQLGTADAWRSFLSQYPTGFYAELAKGQLAKLGAEEARLAAVAKAKAAEEERARLAAANASPVALAQASAAAKAAEEARMAAEQAKAAETAKSDAAEQARLAAEQRSAATAADKAPQVASLSPPGAAAASPQDIARALQGELRRVGCFTGNVDGNWQAPSQRSLEQFNKYAGSRLNVKLASLDAVDAVKTKSGRVCPLVCSYGYQANGERCDKIVCRAGYELGDDNSCEKIVPRKPVTARRDAAPARTSQGPARQPQASGELACGRGGCSAVSKGCHVQAGLMNDTVVCN